MNNDFENKFGSVIYNRINEIPMSATERLAAMNAMRDADAIVDAVTWIGRKIEQIGGYLLMKPSVKH